MVWYGRIWIEPDWNVKEVEVEVEEEIEEIWIEPDWNVKIIQKVGAVVMDVFE